MVESVFEITGEPVEDFDDVLRLNDDDLCG